MTTARPKRYPIYCNALHHRLADGLPDNGSCRIRRLNGCFEQMGSSLTESANITIKLGGGNSVSQAAGKVVHSQPNRGIGMEFQNLEPRYAAVLETWLSEAKHLNMYEETT